ncbi:MAG: sulfur oxidation c-type cytochrome SoxX [Rubrivivax sp.]
MSAVLLAGLLQAVLVVGAAIPAPLTATPGDADRGRAIVASREQGLCLLCHNGPAALFPEDRTPGTVAGSLAGVGNRYTPGQLRLRVANARALNPDSPMPAYLLTDAGQRVAPAWRGRTLLSAQQVEVVVAFLSGLSE